MQDTKPQQELRQESKLKDQCVQITQPLTFESVLSPGLWVIPKSGDLIVNVSCSPPIDYAVMNNDQIIYYLAASDKTSVFPQMNLTRSTNYFTLMNLSQQSIPNPIVNVTYGIVDLVQRKQLMKTNDVFVSGYCS